MSDIAVTIHTIRAWHRKRCFAMEMRKRADLAMASFLRTQLGWSLSLPEKERSRINAQALALMKAAELEARGKDPDTDEPDYAEWRGLMLTAIQSRAAWDVTEAEATKEMERLAASLPVWTAWAADIRGFGARSLAVIVGEAGDLSAYPKKGHLWKRMGVAVIDGVRQGGLRKTAAKEEWIAHGYSRVRRSRLWTIGDAMVKCTGGTYREVYLRRKDYERAKAEAAGLTVKPSAQIKAAERDSCISDGHIHRRAQRYMEKRLLRDLWQAWRRATVALPERAKSHVPAAEEHRDAA